MNNFVKKWISVLPLLLLCFTTIYAQTDPQPSIERLILRQTSSQVELLSLNEDGSVTLITYLEDVSFLPVYGFEWEIPLAIDVYPSAQGQHVAFTARAVDNRAALFLVSLNPLRIERFDAPGIAALSWSPAGDAVLLTSPTLYLGGEGGALSNGQIYIFDLATKTFTLIAENSPFQIVRDAVWSPNGDSVILNIEDSDNTLDLQLADLYRVNRNGTNREQLTDLKTQAPQSINFDQPVDRNQCRISNIEWAAFAGRIYYVLVCSVYSEVPVISLFSVDLDGNNRLEADLFEAVSAEFTPQAAVGHDLVGLFAGQTKIYLVVNSPLFNLVIVSVDASGHVEIEVTIPFKEGRWAAISEHGAALALSMDGGEAAAIDLMSGDVTSLSLMSSVVCRIQWIGDETILIDEVVSCNRGNSRFFTPINTVAWIPSTGITRDMTETVVGDFTLIIPLPTIPELSVGLNQSPIANAGADQIVSDTDGDGFADITLDGSQSIDADGVIIDYKWYSNGMELFNEVKPAGLLPVGDNLLTLLVTDDQGLTGIDFVNIKILSSVTPTETHTPSPTFTPIPTSTPIPEVSCTVNITAGDSLALVNAISAANANGNSHDTICLAQDSTYIFFSASSNIALPSITTPITIVGNGSILERSSGAPNFRFFNVTATGNLTLEHLTLRNGSATGNNGGTILNAGMLTLSDVTLANNAARFGGAIHSTGTLTITGGAITGSSAQENAGAIYANSGTVTITDTVFEDNSARYGSSIYLNNGSASLTDVTIRGNTANEQGAGVYLRAGTLTIDGGLFENNTARFGNGVYVDAGTATISGVVMQDNIATEEGAAIYNRTGTLAIANSIFEDNRARYGAAISNRGPITVTGSTFTDNIAVENGGALYNTNNTSANRVQNACFSGNTARFGGAVFSSTANFNARDNWWGSDTGPTGAMVNNNVQTAPFLTDGCPH